MQAARICRAVAQIELLREYHPEQFSARLLADAFALGRAVTLFRAYAGPSTRPARSPSDLQQRIQREFERLLAAGRTATDARSILQMRGDFGSKAQIWRVTSKLLRQK